MLLVNAKDIVMEDIASTNQLSLNLSIAFLPWQCLRLRIIWVLNLRKQRLENEAYLKLLLGD